MSKIKKEVYRYLSNILMMDDEEVEEVTDEVMRITNPNIVYEVRVWSVLSDKDEVQRAWYNDYYEACSFAEGSLYEAKVIGDFLDPDNFSTTFAPSQGSKRARVIRHHIN